MTEPSDDPFRRQDHGIPRSAKVRGVRAVLHRWRLLGPSEVASAAPLAKPPIGCSPDERRSRLAPLFDESWYRARHGAGADDAYQHYMTSGVALGAKPNPYFDTNWYLKTHPDVTAQGVNPLEHYALFGWREGRNPSAAFDGARYLDDNPDVRAAGISPLQHYLSHGRSEGRPVFDILGKPREKIAPLVDDDWYAAAHPQAIADPYLHYMTVGAAAGADPNAFFDTDWYLEMYPDVRDGGMNPLEHYALFGWKQGRDPSAAFDGERYLDDHPDVRATPISPLQHYLTLGRREKRRIYPVAERASRPTAPVGARKKWRVPMAVTGTCEGDEIDRAMAALLRRFAPHCVERGPIAIVVVAGPGREKAAENFAEAFLLERPRKSALLLVTGDEGVAQSPPPGVLYMRIADFAGKLANSGNVEFLLRILRASRPEVLLVCDSDLGWALLAQKGARVKALTRVVGTHSRGSAVARYYCHEMLDGDGGSGHVLPSGSGTAA